MNAGKLRHRLELYSPSASQDAYGESDLTYSKYATVWGSVQPLKGREMLHARAINAESDVQVRIRYNSSIAVTHKIKFDSRWLEVVFIANVDERNKEQLILCKEVQ